MSDESQDVFTMTPEQATAELARMTEAYRGPAPTGTPTTPAEAAARLNSLTTDKAWSERFTKGDAATMAEYRNLTQIASQGDGTVGIETVDSISDSHALPRAGYETLLDGLREQGLPEIAEQQIRNLDSGGTDRPTSGDGVAAKAALNRLTRDPAFGKKYLEGEVEATNLVNGLNRIIALAGDDNQPATAPFNSFLQERGLQSPSSRNCAPSLTPARWLTA